MPIDLFVRVTVLPLLKQKPWTIWEAKKLAELRLKFIEVSEELGRELERVIHRFMEYKSGEDSGRC